MAKAAKAKQSRSTRVGDVAATLLAERADELLALSDSCRMLSLLMRDIPVEAIKAVDGTPGYVGSRTQIKDWLERIADHSRVRFAQPLMRQNLGIDPIRKLT